LANATLKTFLAETLELWHVAGTVNCGVAPMVAIVRTENGAIVWIEETARAGDTDVERKDEPPAFRWSVRWRGAGEAPGAPREVRPRMCGSINGVLSALRAALDVDRGNPVRIAPAPRSASRTDTRRLPE
jgi:hypothetical protein